MTARPKLDKIIKTIPLYVYYKPEGVSMDKLGEVNLTIEELEALNLKDRQMLNQVDCAGRMGISRSTFQRLLKSARGKMISAIIEGKAIKFEGGNYISGEHITTRTCLKGTYHFKIRREDLAENDQEYKLSKIRCPACGRRLVEFK
ncbi:MAG: DUF134 domain-containing protein [Actinobacteria bacterium]|nr:DUF134 domain-containing protein [Actinomycetota bacterium]